MDKKIIYSRSNAYSIVLAALLLARNPGTESKVSKSKTFHITTNDIEENKKVIAKNHVLHLLSEDALDSEENLQGKKIAIAIVSLYGDLDVPSNVALLNETNNPDLKTIKRLEYEGDLILRYEKFREDFNDGAFLEEYLDNLEDEDDDDDVFDGQKQPDQPVSGQNGSPIQGDDNKKVKLGSDGPVDGAEQHEEPIVSAKNNATNGPEQNVAPIVGSEKDGQKSTNLANKVPGKNSKLPAKNKNKPNKNSK